MARDHARIQTAIWRDPDFRALRLEAQHTYLALASQQALTYAGVIDHRPGRLASLSEGTTTRKVEAALALLIDRNFIVVDRQTEELLVRSYVRHDGVMARVNMGKAVGRAIDQIVSLALRRAVLVELARLHSERPDLAGWQGLADLNPDAMAGVHALALATEQAIPRPVPTPMPSANACRPSWAMPSAERQASHHRRDAP